MYITITVDTENLQTPLKNNDYDFNVIDYEVNNDNISSSRLIDIFNKYSVSAVFFLAINEIDKFGKESYRNLISKLNKSEQDIQIHSHPFWSDKYKQRIHMHEYTLQEQKELIKNMLNDLRELGCSNILAHRAGAYGANDDTMEALKENSIFIDSSYFYQHSNCHIQATKVNVFSKLNGLLEIPVTGFFRITYLRLFFINIQLKKQFIKTDLNSCSLEELIYFVEHAKKNGLNFMNFFLHSYSLMNFNKATSSFTLNDKEEKKLVGFLEYLKTQDDIQIVNFQQINQLIQEENMLDIQDFIPEYKKFLTINTVIKKLFDKLQRKFNC